LAEWKISSVNRITVNDGEAFEWRKPCVSGVFEFSPVEALFSKTSSTAASANTV
jgi:hypothetical protein